MPEECFKITKYDDEYIIRLNGIDYNDKEKAYICENDLPMNIEILYKHDGNPVNGIEWDWSDCECNPSSPMDHTATISISPTDNFEGDDKLEIYVRFEEQNDIGGNQFDDVGLILNVEKVDRFYFNFYKSAKNAEFAFDNNKISQYPFYEINEVDENGDGTIDRHIPHKFILNQLTGKVTGIGKNNYFKNANIDYERFEIDDDEIVAYLPTPEDLVLQSENNQLTIQSIDLVNSENYLLESCNNENLLNLDIRLSKVLNISFFFSRKR